MAIQATHIGGFYYQAEASYGAGLPASGQQEIPSDSIESVNFTPAMNIQRLPTINDYDYQDTTYGARDYTITVAHPFQQLKAATQHLQTTCLEYYAVTRTAGDLQSIACVLKTGAASWLVFKGAKINSQSLAFSVGEQVNETTELWANNLTTSATLPTGGTPAAAIASTFDTFNGALISRSGKWLAGIKSATLTINNNLERIPRISTTGTQGGDYAYIMPGLQETKLTADIIADGAGKTDIDDLLADPETTIVIQTGITPNYSLKWTLTHPSFNALPVVYTADMKTLILSADMGAENIALSLAA